jgi:hypothetical protein
VVLRAGPMGLPCCVQGTCTPYMVCGVALHVVCSCRRHEPVLLHDARRQAGLDGVLTSATSLRLYCKQVPFNKHGRLHQSARLVWGAGWSGHGPVCCMEPLLAHVLYSCQWPDCCGRLQQPCRFWHRGKLQLSLALA